MLSAGHVHLNGNGVTEFNLECVGVVGPEQPRELSALRVVCVDHVGGAYVSLKQLPGL